MKHVLVTGGAGFIGSALCRHIISNNYRVTNVDKLTYASDLDNVTSLESFPNYRFLQVDICEEQTMLELLLHNRFDGIIHLAAESHVDRSIIDAEDFVRTNVLGTVSLLQAATAVWRSGNCPADFRFLHVSTDEVYGDLPMDGAKFVETSPYLPSSPYAASKAASDHFVNAWNRTHGLPCIISNCSNNYGPYQFPEKLIPLMILNALHERPLPVYGEGLNVRDWLFVEDHAIALQVIFERGKIGESYNVGGNNEWANIDVVNAICDQLDQISPRENDVPHRELISFVKDRPGHDLRYAVNASKIKRELGWQPSVTFKEGLAATISWYVNSANWWTKRYNP